MSDQERLELNELGEFGLIEALTGTFGMENESTKRGVGDDAAVIEYAAGKQTVVSTDMLVEGVHFDMVYTPLKHLGYKSVIVNLSDIYAMNAKPKQITVSIAVSNRYSFQALKELYTGIKLACETYNVDLIGGDTTSSLSGLVISVTAIGEADPKRIVQRTGAQVGDKIFVSGDLGGAYMGLTIMEREKEVFIAAPEAQPDLQGHDYIVGRLLKPEARRDVHELIEESGILPTSMIDISDGLSSELMHIAKHSECGIYIEEERVPIAEQTYNQALDFSIDPINTALNGGEDYELLFTIKAEDAEKLKGSPFVTEIGEVKEASEGVKIFTKGGNTHELLAQGWRHLSDED
jgi:thiamine-monophosphate kinase